ncbi:hypothetical protein C1J03_18705 [Sulfitobacter sp. SK012]|nr:hypothetical protein C1J03_18705 [Sulfitobacter sp. SK012]
MSNGLGGEHHPSLQAGDTRYNPANKINGETWQIGPRLQQSARPENSIWLYFLLIKNLQSIRVPARLDGRNSSAQFGKSIYEPRIELNRTNDDHGAMTESGVWGI